MTDVPVQLAGPRENGIRSGTTDGLGLVRFYGVAPGATHSFSVVDVEALEDFIPIEIADLILGEAAVDTISISMIPHGNCVS